MILNINAPLSIDDFAHHVNGVCQFHNTRPLSIAGEISPTIASFPPDLDSDERREDDHPGDDDPYPDGSDELNGHMEGEGTAGDQQAGVKEPFDRSSFRLVSHADRPLGRECDDAVGGRLAPGSREC